ncbi:MAG: insulinase family protein [Kiritimatiellia bacterium]
MTEQKQPAPGGTCRGFSVLEVTPLPSVRITAYRLKHVATGAEAIHLYCADRENLFSVSFPTPPPDDTGLPHILEHSVLSGSARYPVKEPFFEMAKMSMATFINAMTGPDATYYPVASNVKRDLFNLADVYFDAVFHPLLTEQTFKREGHHLAPADPSQPEGGLTIRGIVYSEMKGVFSDPESRLYRLVSRYLFPDSVYGRESGGDPESIPQLTYEDFRRFHAEHYNPRNARFVLYGNIPTEEYAAFLDERLKNCRAGSPAPPVVKQRRWSEPRRAEESYPVGRGETDTEKTYLALNWLTADLGKPEDVVLLHILSLVLLGNEGAPLKRAITESRLGQDMIHSGDHVVGLETTFGAGLKGSEPDRGPAFEKVVMDSLESIAEGEIDASRVEAAFQQSAYEYREILPAHPLHMLTRVLGAWLYGCDPYTYVCMDDLLEKCRRRYENDPRVFNTLIRRMLLDNPHRLTLMLKPHAGLEERLESDFRSRMEKIKSGMSAREIRSAAEEAEELRRESGKPNPPEAVASLPQLKVSDLPPGPRHIDTETGSLSSGAVLLRNRVFANGVNYLRIWFDLTGLPRYLWAYLPRYSDAVSKLGAGGMDYEETAARVAACTGGIHCWPSFYTDVSDPGRPVWGMLVSMKALDEQIDEALSVLHDVVFAVDPRDKPRLMDVVTQARAHYRTSLIQDGSGTATGHAARGFTPESYLNEIVNGLPQLELAEAICGRFDTESGELASRIEAIRDFMFCRGRLTAGFTGSDSSFETVRRRLEEWTSEMKDSPLSPVPTGYEPYGEPPREGLAAPLQVAYCAEVMPAPHYREEAAPVLSVGSRLVSTEYMLSQIRFKGNAYGAWFSYNPVGGLIRLGSYRDPEVERTLEVFRDTREFVRNTKWSREDVDRAIIGTAKAGEKPIRPEEATGASLNRHLTGQTRELREKWYGGVRSATPSAVKSVLEETLDANSPRGAVCVVASRSKLEEANRKMPGRELSVRDILAF